MTQDTRRQGAWRRLDDSLRRDRDLPDIPSPRGNAMRKWHALVLLLALTAACSDDDPTGPNPAPMTTNLTNGPIVAMTRNMYIGADVDRVIAALSGLSGEDP